METDWLSRAVKNACVEPAFCRPSGEFGGRARDARAKVERLMSLKIAVALAATIGAGALLSTAAEARPSVVGFRGDYSPGTIVVKTNERRLYLIVEQGRAVAYPVGVGRAGKQWAG